MVIWAAAMYVMVNAAFAIISPTDFLSAKWTIRRGLSRDTPPGKVRQIAVIFLLSGAFLVWAGFEMLSGMIQT